MTTSYSALGSGSRQAGCQPVWPFRACWRRVKIEYFIGDLASAGGRAGESVGQMTRRFKAEDCSLKDSQRIDAPSLRPYQHSHDEVKLETSRRAIALIAT